MAHHFRTKLRPACGGGCLPGDDLFEGRFVTEYLYEPVTSKDMHFTFDDYVDVRASNSLLNSKRSLIDR